MDPQLKHLLQNLLQRDPTKRLSWPKLLYHPFIADGKHTYVDNNHILHVSNLYAELDVEGLMQCAREAETSCDRPATPIPAWTNDSQVHPMHTSYD